jgi:hypothetical protein
MTIYKRALLIAAVTVASLAAFGGVAFAATAITVGDGWHGFGTPDNSQPYSQSPFTFTAAGAVVVSVTDVLCPGDRYTASLIGSLGNVEWSTILGTTSVPGSSGCSYAGFTADPDVAVGDPSYSHGRWAIGKGSHSISVALFSSPFPASGGDIRIDELTNDMCANGGWTTIPQFQSEGQCVGSVKTGVVPAPPQPVKKFH